MLTMVSFVNVQLWVGTDLVGWSRETIITVATRQKNYCSDISKVYVRMFPNSAPRIDILSAEQAILHVLKQKSY